MILGGNLLPTTRGLRHLLLSFVILSGLLFTRKSAAQPAPEPLPYGAPDSFAEFHGFVSAFYSAFEKEMGAGVDPDQVPVGFGLDQAMLSARAKIRDTVSVFVELEAIEGELEFD